MSMVVDGPELSHFRTPISPEMMLIHSRCLGVAKSGEATLEAVLVALKNGYRHIDTAQFYGNEADVGKAVRESGIPREEIFVTTKLWQTDQGYEKCLLRFETSLKQLGLDYVDLYLVHSPLSAERLDTWRAMEQLLQSGKARSIGVSNYGIHHLKELFDNCKVRPSCNQLELHPYSTRTELVSFCQKEGIVLEAYTPLTLGQKLNDPGVVEIAKRYNKSTAQLLIKWCLQKGFVVLPKSVTPSRIIENISVFDFEISKEDIAKLDSFDEYLVTHWDPTTAP
ncbi:hypothetical protein R1sor_011369 [Riccia sorocarpa]|uniref:NADP-dependent oxidoreductase domain-containing protein n=1 Tax=Riccia sorocarpa TaxID=122646 RepID=A0ABD3I0R5_9MARC